MNLDDAQPSRPPRGREYLRWHPSATPALRRSFTTLRVRAPLRRTGQEGDAADHRADVHKAGQQPLLSRRRGTDSVQATVLIVRHAQSDWQCSRIPAATNLRSTRCACRGCRRRHLKVLLRAVTTTSNWWKPRDLLPLPSRQCVKPSVRASAG